MTDQEIIRSATLAKLSHKLLPTVPTGLPTWLVQAKRWILYDGNKKPRKWVEGKLKSGGQTDDSAADWLSYETACKVARRYKLGLSIVLGDGVGGIDLDHVRDPGTGELTKFAGELVELSRSLGAYAEVSPSGTGVKIYGWLARTFYGGQDCTIKDGTGETYEKDGKLLPLEAAYECWVRGRHFCVTGQSLHPYAQDPVNISPVLEMIEARFPAQPEEPKEELWFDPRTIPQDDRGGSIAEWFNQINPASIGANLLSAMGWTLHSNGPRESHWTRPGKDPAKGLSGTLFYDHGTFTNYSSAASLPVGGSIPLFKIYSQVYFHGNGSEAARALGQWKRGGCQGGLPMGPYQQVQRSQPQAPQAQPQQVAGRDEKPDFRITSADKLLERYGQISWVWKDWIAGQVLHLITGEPGAGKTLVLNDILLTIFGGGTLPDGAQPPKGLAGKRVLTIDSDQRIHDAGPRLAKGYGLSESIHDVIEWGTDASLRPIVTWEEQGRLFDYASWVLGQGRHWCLVIDTVARFAGSAELNSPKELSKFAEPLQRIARDRNIPVFLVGHSNGSGEAYGRHLRGACQISWLVKKGSRRLSIDRSFSGQPDSLKFSFPPLGREYSPLAWKAAPVEAEADESPEADSLADWLLLRLQELDQVEDQVLAESHRGQGGLIEAAQQAGRVPAGEVSEADVMKHFRLLQRLVKAGKVVETKVKGWKGKKRRVYWLGGPGCLAPKDDITTPSNPQDLPSLSSTPSPLS